MGHLETAHCDKRRGNVLCSGEAFSGHCSICRWGSVPPNLKALTLTMANSKFVETLGDLQIIVVEEKGKV
jgi:hypothetical protein